MRPKDPTADGDRIAILTHNRSLTADLELSNQRILLPAPTPNATCRRQLVSPITQCIILQWGFPLRAWSVDGSGADEDERLTQPIVADGMVFAMDATTRVRAFDEATGGLVSGIGA